MEIRSGELVVVLGANPSATETRVTQLLSERIRNRTGVLVAEGMVTPKAPGKAQFEASVTFRGKILTQKLEIEIVK